MKLLKLICPICGSNKLIDINNKFKCNACDTELVKQDNLSEEKVKIISALYDAESFIRMSPPRFDFAEEKYRIIVHDYPREASAYWGLFKSKNEIKYIDGKPICFNYEKKNVLNDSDFQNTLKFATNEEQYRYKEELKKIEDNIQEWNIRANELDYDIFVSFNSHYEKDYNDATNLNSYLIQNGFKVFFSPVEMKNKVGEPNYDAYIFNALVKSKVLIVIGTKKESFESEWVRSEWSRYSYLMDEYDKEKDSLIVCYENLNPNDLDFVLRKRQMVNMAEKNCYETIKLKIFNILGELYNKLEKNKISRIINPKLEEYERQEIIEKLPKKEFNSSLFKKCEYNILDNLPKIDTKHIGKVYTSKNDNDNVEIKISKIKRMLERHEFDFVEKYILELTKIDPNNPNFILYKLLYDYKCGTFEELIKNKIDSIIDEDLEKLSSAIEYSSDENASLILSKLSDYVIEEINNKNFKNALKVYREIVYYDEKIIVELRHHIINLVLSMNEFYNVFEDILNLSLKYLVSNLSDYKETLKKIIERLFSIHCKKYIDDFKYEVLNHYFEIYSKVSDFNYDYYIFKLKIDNKTEDLDDAIMNLTSQNRINELTEILDNTDEKSAILIIDDVVKSIKKIFKLKEFEACYETLKIILQYDFPDKKSVLSYLAEECISHASKDNDKIFILIISVLDELLKNEKISYYQNTCDLIIKYDSDWLLIEKYSKFDEIRKLVIEETCNYIDYNIFSKFISLEELEIRNEHIELNNINLEVSDLKIICLPAALIKGNLLAKVPEIKIIKSNVIENELFKNYINLRKVIVDDGVEIIGDNAFYGCENLIEIELPLTLKTVSNNSFAKCFFEFAKVPLSIVDKINKSKLINLSIIGEGEIDLSFINECVSLKKLTIEYGFTTIKRSSHMVAKREEDHSYYYKYFKVKYNYKYVDYFSKLTCVEISDSVKNIEEGILFGCRLLESIKIPFVGDKRHALNDELQPPLGYLFGNSNSSKMEKISQYKYKGAGKELVYEDKKYIHIPYEYCTIENYDIPKSLSEVIITDCDYIPHGSFSNCKNLTNIKLPNTLKVIGDYAFYNCISLKSIELPETITCIGYSAFNMSGCTTIDYELTVLKNEYAERAKKAEEEVRKIVSKAEFEAKSRAETSLKMRKMLNKLNK